MANHCGQFGLVVQLHQQAPVDGNLATGQRPGIGNRVVEDDEFVGQLSVTDCDQAIADLLHVGGQPAIDTELPPLALLRGSVLLLTDGDLALLRDKSQLTLAGNGVDGAT